MFINLKIRNGSVKNPEQGWFFNVTRWGISPIDNQLRKYSLSIYRKGSLGRYKGVLRKLKCQDKIFQLF